MKFNVLANGPSLASFDLTKFEPSSTVGMNTAFRHWNKIDWFPEIYVSADPVVTAQNAAEIGELLTSKRVRTAILNRTFLEKTDQTNFHELPIQSLVLMSNDEALDLDLFRSHWTTFSTTGSIAIRLASAMGASEISLYGYDLSYMDWRQARASPFSIARKRTSSASRDYFFEEYQVEGDAFQTPNPRFLPFNLHRTAVINSIKAVRGERPDVIFSQHGAQSLAKFMDRQDET